MNLAVAFVLFFLLTPQLFFKFKGNKFVVAAVHALVFVAILHFIPIMEGIAMNTVKQHDFYQKNCSPLNSSDVVKPGDCGKFSSAQTGKGGPIYRCNMVTKDPKTGKTTCSFA
jgi:hypothetical protein